MRTVRFKQLVQTAGTPETYLSWSPPEKDAELKRLVAAGRVLTVHQELRGTHKDFGIVGLHREGSGQVLVFPRSLRKYARARVVALDYKLLADRSHGAGAAAPPAQPPKSRRSARQIPTPSTDANETSSRASAASSPRAKGGESPRPELSREDLIAGIRRAAADLKAGRAVQAYEKLQTLLGKS